MSTKQKASPFTSPTIFPLRITSQEWGKNFTADDAYNAATYTYDCFILKAWLEWTGNYESGGWDYCEMYEVTCRFGRQRNATFGPHKTNGLAKRKALAFLVANGALEIIEG